MTSMSLWAIGISLLVWSCGKQKDPPIPSEPELISTVRLIFSSDSQKTIAYDYRVLDGEKQVDTIHLAENQTYHLEIRFLHEYGTEAEDLTQEILDEAEEHLVILQSIPYEFIQWESGNQDPNGKPLNQEVSVRTGDAGEGSLRILLMHRPTNKFGTDPSDSGGETDADALFPMVIVP